MNIIKINIKMQRTKIFLISIILLVANLRHVTAAPGSMFSSSAKSDDQQSLSPLSCIVSKAMGAIVKCASFACQWLPVPDFIKPARPTLKIVKAPKLYNRDVDFSCEDFD